MNDVFDKIIENQKDNCIFLQMWRIREHYEMMQRYHFPVEPRDVLKDWVTSGYSTTFSENWNQAPEFYDNIVSYLRQEDDRLMLNDFARVLMGNDFNKERFFDYNEDGGYQNDFLAR